MKKHVFLRLISALLMLTAIFTLTSPFASAASGKYYTDVATTSPAYKAVNYLREHNIMNGTSETKFSPNGTLTRGQIVTIFHRMLNMPKTENAVSFSDCKKGEYYYEAVQWAVDAGITNGCGGEKFNPEGKLTQQEAIIFLYRFIKHCGYDMLLDSTYAGIFKANMKYQGSFWECSQAATGWAFNCGLINNKVLGTATCPRSDAAIYIYSLYNKFQRKYALTVVNTHNLEVKVSGKTINAGSYCGEGMTKLFKEAGTTKAVYCKDITKADFKESMKGTFEKAKKLDICYLFCYSHGQEGGLILFKSGPNDVYDQTKLVPVELREQINKYSGTFVVFIAGCHSGTYVNRGVNKTKTTVADSFDAEAFAMELVNVEEKATRGRITLRDDKNNRIKVLCSAQQDELSTRFWSAYYWAAGCGYDIENSRSTDNLEADVPNDRGISDGRISLDELHSYSNEKIMKYNEEHEDEIDWEQHMVCYPENDNYIIYEKGY